MFIEKEREPKLKKLGLMLVFPLLIGLTSCKEKTPFENINIEFGEFSVEKDKYGNYYHIFVQTFRDANKDGIGDLEGVIDSLDYLRKENNPYYFNSLGVDGIYLSPIFQAPSYHKYDAVSYLQIDESFGNMETFKTLIKEAHKRGLKVMMDMAFNHISTNSEEFKIAVDALKNEFVCKNPDSLSKKPTDSCISKVKQVGYFNFSSESSNLANASAKVDNTPYYYETFSDGSNMADWNLDNTDVRNMIVDVLKYYLDLGVDGFRLDAITSFYGNSSSGIGSYDALVKTGEVLSLIQNTVNSYDVNNYVVAEGPWSNSEIKELYTDPDNPEKKQNLLSVTNLDSYFSFDNSFRNVNKGSTRIVSNQLNLKNGSSTLAEKLSKQFTNYEYPYEENTQQGDSDEFIRNNKVQANFLSNHDIGRIGGNFVNKASNMNEIAKASSLRAYKFFYGVYNLQYGSNFLYYGDELGMTGNPQQSGVSSYQDTIARQPMLWTDETVRPTLDMIPVSDTSVFDTKQETLDQLGTMDEQLKDKNSLFNYFREMYYIKGHLRDIQKQLASDVSYDNNTGLLTFKKGDNLRIVINCSENKQNYDLSSLDLNSFNLKYYLVSDSSEKVTSSQNLLNMPQYSIAFYVKGGI